MNLHLKFVSFVVVVLIAVGCKQNDSEPKSSKVGGALAQTANLQTASFQIDGMTCSMGCARTIEKKLAQLEGVKSAKIDFEKKSATVQYDATLQTPEQLVKAVESAADGSTYKVSSLKNSGDQAYFVKEKEKEKEKKKKNKKEETTTDKKEGCSSSAKPTGGCCSAKKAACGSEKSTM